MRRMHVRVASPRIVTLTLLAPFMLAACLEFGYNPTPSIDLKASSADATIPPGEIALPAGRPAVSGTPPACAGVGLEAVLRGDSHDPRIAWLMDTTSGTRLDVTWPPGYRARFAPKLEVLDESGTVVLRDGDPITGACVTSDPNIHQLEPPFN